MTVKPGWRTTEFWVTLATLAGAVAALVNNQLSQQVQAIVAAAGGLVVAGYGAGRVLLKTTVAQLPPTVPAPVLPAGQPPPPGS